MPPIDTVRNIQRWGDVQAILLRYGFDILMDQEDIKEARRVLHEKFDLQVGEFEDRTVPERVCLMLQELGPTYVKLGQIMASRADLLPPEWIEELAKLHDAVAPFPYEQVREVIAAEFGVPLEELFTEFDPEPVAAASIGQVHTAKLKDGNLVAIKVQRPNIWEQVHADMEIMHEIAKIIEARTNWGRDYGVVGIVQEFARVVEEELDYRNEAYNAERLRGNLAEFAGVGVPFVHWRLVTPRVLTTEQVQGVKITNLTALDDAGIDRVALADVFIRSMLKQSLLDGFFHADPHPGNLFVDGESGKLYFLDLGMMGHLLADDREHLDDMIVAMLNRDSYALVRIVMAVGTPYRPVDEMAMRRDVDRQLDRYLNMSLEDISFSFLLTEVMNTVFEHGIRLPSSFTMSAKSLLQSEEVARTLNPDIEIIEVMQTAAQQLFWQRLDPRTLFSHFLRETTEMMRLMRSIPRISERLMKQMESGMLPVQIDIPDIKGQMTHLTIIANRLTAGLIMVGMIVGSAIAMGISPQQSWAFIPFLGVIAFCVSMGIGVLLVWRVLMDLLQADRRKNRES